MSFQNVSYSVEGRIVLDRFSLDVEQNETIVLLGRSGSGKTTALRLINRMLQPTSGAIFIDGQNTMELNPIELRRKIGYVIQEFGLLPHWTVEQNIGLVPRLLDWPPEKQRKRSRELLVQVGLDPEQVSVRLPSELSGGQRQRVAVARALAARPSILLLDEPFGALDPVTRHDMQQEFLKLRAEYNFLSIFVTHDLLEAMAIATRIAVLDRGKVEAFTTPSQLFAVQTPTVRAFLDTLPEGFRKG